LATLAWKTAKDCESPDSELDSVTERGPIEFYYVIAALSVADELLGFFGTRDGVTLKWPQGAALGSLPSRVRELRMFWRFLFFRKAA
jgi:hypothetical protein